jgi:MtN3 and saliva related transmembrane protein
LLSLKKSCTELKNKDIDPVPSADRRLRVQGKLDLLGYVAAVLTSGAFVPQAVKTIRSRDTRAISLWMYLAFTTGVAIWLVYGVALQSLPIILANTVTLVLAATILALKVRFG